MAFLPVTKKELDERGWYQPDFVVVTGDAYVDHPSFGTAIIGRILEAAGFSIAVLAQPKWSDESDFKRFGCPRLGFMIGSGNIDSMVAHYTAAKKKRSDDAYSPGRAAGKRPDRALIVYSKLAKRAYPDVPVIIGGLEASLRRFAHYDYWDDEIKPSILIESGADILSYGMSEYQTLEIANRLNSYEPVTKLTGIKGTCVAVPVSSYKPMSAAECPSLGQVTQSKREYAVSCKIQQDEQDWVRGKTVIQRHGDKILIQNPPAPPLTPEEFDRVYELPYERTYHPMYEPMGGVPAIEEVKFSIIHNRGCFGACAFCSIAFHQGRSITCRSEQSVIKEAVMLTKDPQFKGYIHDVGGPTANFRRQSCEIQSKNGLCKGKRCLAPKPCPNMEVNHEEYLEILRKLRAVPKVKKVFIRSGVRYDYLILDKDKTFFNELVNYHVSGQLKVAPEHCSAVVLDAMGKPHIEAYKRFAEEFYRISENAGKKQFIVPYLMSSHPGSTLREAVELAVFLKKEKIRPEQVQDFYPTPGTISTCMFYTGLDPYTLKEIYVPKTPAEKAMQRALLQYFKKENYDIVLAALKQAGRMDLVGNEAHCLIRPPAGSTRGQKKDSKGNTSKAGKARTTTDRNRKRKKPRGKK
ncbi:MAG: YgiQ family radical SAM protein [Oscillospiraceae bacterium]|jgi:uncharacterized radical SAM protein YgiQ|nr:YgiQ family radical SAM protein [Oscillospiraceae bacterium]